MEADQVNSLVRSWLARARGEKVAEFTPFDSFLALWIAFNAWAMFRTGARSDRAMINRLGADNALRSRHCLLMNEASYKLAVSHLKSLTPVRDTRQNPEAPVAINDEQSWGDIITVIYRIRCNLFHGRKSPEASRSLELVQAAYAVLMGFLDLTVSELEIR
jgi:hypothetical protein